MPGVKKWFNDLEEWPHLEVARNALAAWRYAQKEDTRVLGPWIYGEGPQQGKRSDIEECIQLARQGKTLGELADVHPGTTIRYGRHFKEFFAREHAPVVDRPASRRDVRVCVLHGPTGTGKSHHAFEPFINAEGDLEEKRCYIKGDSSKWFDGYQDQEFVIFEEFYPDEYFNKCSTFLRLTDKWPCQVQVKGGYRKWRARTIIFTTNSDPKDWFRDHADAEAFQRRITLDVKLEMDDVTVRKGDLNDWKDVWPEGIKCREEEAQRSDREEEEEEEGHEAWEKYAYGV